MLAARGAYFRHHARIALCDQACLVVGKYTLQRTAVSYLRWLLYLQSAGIFLLTISYLIPVLSEGNGTLRLQGILNFAKVHK